MSIKPPRPSLLIILFTLLLTICHADDLESAANIHHEAPVIYNLPLSGANPNTPANNGANYLYGVFELYTKLDTVMKLMENGFGKTNERIDKMEKKVGRLEMMLEEVISKLDQFKTDQLATQYLADRFNKLYNVNTETYTICKEAVQNPDKGSSLFSPKYNSRSSSSSGSAHQSDVIVENGDKTLDDVPSAKQFTPQPTKEHEEMIFVISTVANVTLQKYFNLIEKKMAEEFDIFNFQLREKLDPTEDTLTKVKTVSKHLLDSNDQINSALLEIKDQLGDEQTLISSMESKLNTKIELMKQLAEQKQKEEAETAEAIPPKVVTACENAAIVQNTSAIVEAKIRQLFEEYLDKLVTNRSVKSNEIVPESNPAVQDRKGKVYAKPVDNEEQLQQSKPQVQSLPAQLYSTTSKPPIKFVTITAVYSGAQHVDTSAAAASMAVDQIEAKPDTTAISSKPEFRPAKTTHFDRLNCTVRSAISYPKSCSELREHGATCDAVYVIIMRKFALKHVYCDMRHLQGGWTVILRRGRFAHTKQITFDHTYPAYRSGFGDMHLGEFFLGLDTIHQLSNEDGPHVLQIDLEDTSGEYISLQYDGFRIGGLEEDFRFYVDQIRCHDHDQGTLSLGHYRQLASVLLAHNGSSFFTADRVRKYLDARSSGPPNQQLAFINDCAKAFQSGWWYSGSSLVHYLEKNEACRQANGFQLMAPIDRSSSTSSHKSSHIRNRFGHHNSYGSQQVALAQHSTNPPMAMYWSKWTHADGSPRVLKYVLMKIRPASFSLSKMHRKVSAA